MEIPIETQFSLDTFDPQGLAAGAVGGAASPRFQKTYFVRCRPTLRWWKASQYNCSIVGLPVPVKLQPLPYGRVQIAVYRSIIPVPRSFATATPFATMVPGTLYDSGSVLTPLNITTANFANAVTATSVTALGGCYWIVVRLQDTTASGTSFYIFTIQGWTIVDTNVVSVLLQDTASTGNLPATYNANQVAVMTAEYPFVRADYV